jgi:hypothetical protein
LNSGREEGFEHLGERAYFDAALKWAGSLLEREAVDESHSIADRTLGMYPYSDALARRAIGSTPGPSGGGRSRTVPPFRGCSTRSLEPGPETLSLIESLKVCDWRLKGDG